MNCLATKRACDSRHSCRQCIAVVVTGTPGIALLSVIPGIRTVGRLNVAEVVRERSV